MMSFLVVQDSAQGEETQTRVRGVRAREGEKVPDNSVVLRVSFVVSLSSSVSILFYNSSTDRLIAQSKWLGE